MSRRFKVLLLCGMIAATASLILYSAFSHSGRTDSSGGHYNRKTGGYHYHGTPKSSTSTYSSTASSSGTQSSAIQSSEVPSSEIAALTSEIRSLRASVETLDNSVQTLITRMDASADNTMVYITRTGAKYHRDGCRYLKSSKIPISLTDAKKQYSPCSVCNL